MDCQSYFFRLLARREYSAWELQRKAREKGYAEADIEAAIAELQERDYQSDRRVVENAILSARGKYGQPVVKRKCREKGISDEVFEEMWAALAATEPDVEGDELAELKAKAMRKYKLTTFENIDPKTKSKLFNFLRYRGFNPVELLRQWQESN